jgi:hypothetical protein
VNLGGQTSFGLVADPSTLALGCGANPEHPNQVSVGQPSDALVAQAEAKAAPNIAHVSGLSRQSHDRPRHRRPRRYRPPLPFTPATSRERHRGQR